MRALALSLPALLVACKDPAPREQPATAAPPAMSTPPPATSTTSTPAAGINHLGFALWPHLPAGNLAFSPASVAIPLAIAWGGAKGTTAAQLGTALELPANAAADRTLSTWGTLSKELVGGKRPFTLKVANRLYGEKTYNIDTTYFTIVRHAFDAWIEPVDFVSSHEAVREKINAWVSEQTEGRITNLLPPRSVGPATTLAIVNAIYFLAEWSTAFDKAATQPRPFWVNGTTETPVPTMQRRGSFRYAHDGGASLVELPYKSDAASMYVLVPDARDGLPALEKTAVATLRSLQTKLAAQDLLLALPKFTLDTPAPLQLDRALQAIGVTDAFDPNKADFTGIANPPDPRQRLFVGTVLHKAFVKVDEAGTEAAAATAIVMPRGGAPRPATELLIDRPFMFVIVDKATGIILFVGRVVEPKA